MGWTQELPNNSFSKTESLIVLVTPYPRAQLDSAGLIWAKYAPKKKKKQIFVAIQLGAKTTFSILQSNISCYTAFLKYKSGLFVFFSPFLWLHGRKASKNIVSRRVFLSGHPWTGRGKKLTWIFLPCCWVIFAVRLASMALCSSISSFSAVMLSFSMSWNTRDGS